MAGLHHRVQKSPSSMGGPDHQNRSRSHAGGQVFNHTSLLLSLRPHQGGEEDDVVLAEDGGGDVEDIPCEEGHPGGEVRVGCDETGGEGVGVGVEVEVVEDGGGEVAGGEYDGGEWKRAGADEGETAGGGGVRAEEVGFEAGEGEVVGVVREGVEEGVVQGGGIGCVRHASSVVAFQEGLCVSAEGDEVGPQVLDLGAELCGDVDRVWGNAGEDQLGEEGVDHRRRVEAVQTGDFVVQFADFLDHWIGAANHNVNG